MATSPPRRRTLVEDFDEGRRAIRVLAGPDGHGLALPHEAQPRAARWTIGLQRHGQCGLTILIGHAPRTPTDQVQADRAIVCRRSTLLGRKRADRFGWTGFLLA